MILKSTSLDGQHVLEFDEEPHSYTLDGGLVPGVTTFNKEGYPESIYLSMWKAGEAAKYAVNSLLGYLSSSNELKQEEIEKIVKSSKRAWMVPAKAAASIGTVVHDYAYAHSNGKPFDDAVILQHPGAQKILSCISQYKEWDSKDECEKVAAEQIVGSVKYRFGGKFDRLDKVKGKLRIRDYKTSSGIYMDMFIQMASYKIAIKEWLGLDVEELEIVRFGKDGEFETKLVTDPNAISDFEAQAIRNRSTSMFRDFYESTGF